ncbi:MAG: hypothetical protein U0M33_08135 [Lachnospiraceae bacterium]|nr:hypothetical protein [Lachnospiraceae bacterium]
MEKRSVDSYGLSCEVAGVAAVLIGLGNMFDEKCDRLNEENIKLALSGVASYLERLADDIAEL